MSDRDLVAAALAQKYPQKIAYPSFLPNVIDPSPDQAKVLAEIAKALELHESHNLWPAEKAYRRIIDKYDSPRAKVLLGVLLDQKDSNPKALEMARQALATDPDDMLAHGNYGGVMHTLGRVREAIEHYTLAVEAAPYYSEAHIGLGSAFADVLRHREAVYAYRNGVTYDPGNFPYWSDLIFTTDLSDAHTFEDSMAVRREVNDRFMVPLMQEPIVHTNDLDPDRVLRLGFASADMYQHSGATTWGGWLTKLDRSQFHVTLYSATMKHDDMTEKFMANCDQWYDVQDWPDDTLAIQVVKDKIDILVDLAGFTRGGRLPTFARRPAPIQVSGWGYATGTGLDCMDYFATDSVVVPQSDEGRYHEAPWRLPSALSWVPSAEQTFIDGHWSGIPVGHVRGAYGRPFCFGVFNRQPKITRSFVSACAEILRRVPGSMLVMKNGRLDHQQVRDAVEQAFDEEFRARGMVDENGETIPRVALFGQGNHWNQLAAHWTVDVMLDPFPQGGGVSAFESLWMGVPMVTLLGDRPSGRIGASLLTQVDLPDWITDDTEAYIQRAVEAARDLETLKAIRSTLRERVYAMPATQLKSYAENVESWFRTIWQSYTRRTLAARSEAA